MYLSRLILNPRSRDVRRDLGDCHELHRTLLSAFPDLPEAQGNAREQFGMLYRIEQDPHSGVPRLLVQSRVMPDWEQLDRGYLAGGGDPFDPEPYACRALDDAWASIHNDDVLIFRLRANPTKRLSKRGNTHADDPLRGKRVHLRCEKEWNPWLERQGQRGGFKILTVSSRTDATPEWHEQMGTTASPNDTSARIPDVRANPGLIVTGHKEIRSKRATMTFGSVLFEGRMEVTDAESFRSALAKGIGPGKAYGFGLLSIARPRD